jgi:putative phosphoribosyl transferase
VPQKGLRSQRADKPVVERVAVRDRHPFADRQEAGQALARTLQSLRLDKPLVLALPRGGVPVAVEVAKALSAPLDLLLVRKIGAPGQPELAVGAVAGLGASRQTLLDAGLMAATGAEPAHMERETARALAEMERRRQRYLKGRATAAVGGRTVIVVDDGIATGTTVRAALKALRALKPACVVLAVPVAPASALPALAPLVDTLVCLWTPEPFYAVGAHYLDFRQVSDEEVVAALGSALGPVQAAAIPDQT